MEERATSRRPRVVLIALGLLWTHLLVFFGNYIMWGLIPNAVGVDDPFSLLTLALMVFGTLLMVTIRYIGRGANWARLVYLPVLGIGGTYALQALSRGLVIRTTYIKETAAMAELEKTWAAMPVQEQQAIQENPYCLDCDSSTHFFRAHPITRGT